MNHYPIIVPLYTFHIKDKKVEETPTLQVPTKNIDYPLYEPVHYNHHYKRTPIINEQDRVEIVKYIKPVDKVIFPCPLIIDMNFINDHNIDMVVHGFSNETDRNNQQTFFEIIKTHECFMEIDYYSKTSTTDIINKIKNG